MRRWLDGPEVIRAGRDLGDIPHSLMVFSPCCFFGDP